MANIEVKTKNAPAAIGPYSQAIVAHGFLYVSGQIPLDPASGLMVEGGIRAQAHQVLKNIGAILREAGADYRNVVKTTVLLADMANFQIVNAIYAEYFKDDPKPARAAFAVRELPKSSLIEIEAIAAL